MFGPKSLVGSAFLLAGTVFFAAGIWKTWEANEYARQGIQAQGTVTDVRRHQSGGRGRGNWRPTVVFSDRDGRTHVFVARPGSLLSSTWKVGDSVPVVYRPAQPARAILDTVRGRYGWLSASVFASLFMVLGIWLIRSERQELAHLGD